MKSLNLLLKSKDKLLHYKEVEIKFRDKNPENIIKVKDNHIFELTKQIEELTINLQKYILKEEETSDHVQMSEISEINEENLQEYHAKIINERITIASYEQNESTAKVQVRCKF